MELCPINSSSVASPRSVDVVCASSVAGTPDASAARTRRRTVFIGDLPLFDTSGRNVTFQPCSARELPDGLQSSTVNPVLSAAVCALVTGRGTNCAVPHSPAHLAAVQKRTISRNGVD